MIKSVPRNKGLIYHDEDLLFVGGGGDKRCFLHTKQSHVCGMRLIKRHLGQITEEKKGRDKSSLEKRFCLCDCCSVLLNGGCTHVLSELNNQRSIIVKGLQERTIINYEPHCVVGLNQSSCQQK